MVRSRIRGFKRSLGFVLVVPLFLLGISQTFVFGGKAPVEKTGQITSYADTGGEDGDLQKGVAWPNPRFTDNGNGTVTDNLTKLIWLKDANILASDQDSGGFRDWFGALEEANNLASGSRGLTDGSKAGDWRLPNVKELESLIDFAFSNPALSDESGKHQWSEGHPFINVESVYWSSTTKASNDIYAFAMGMTDGVASPSSKLNKKFAWMVRGGK